MGVRKMILCNNGYDNSSLRDLDYEIEIGKTIQTPMTIVEIRHCPFSLVYIHAWLIWFQDSRFIFLVDFIRRCTYYTVRVQGPGMMWYCTVGLGRIGLL
jgi:hypothetical protein